MEIRSYLLSPLIDKYQAFKFQTPSLKPHPSNYSETSRETSQKFPSFLKYQYHQAVISNPQQEPHHHKLISLTRLPHNCL